jgi:NADH dehydrogenase [ubiquinone] 1 alpha subcomplex assembly factor 1
MIREQKIKWFCRLGALGSILMLSVSILQAQQREKAQTDKVTLLDFSIIKDPIPFFNADDGVMGGKSNSSMTLGYGVLIFQGSLSLANNGGFASCFVSHNFPDLANYTALRLRIKGDGRRYGCSIISALNVSSVVHRYYFNTVKDVWIEIDIPFADFYPTRRWETLPSRLKINKERITSIGFIIADKVESAFKLEIESISVLL